MMIARSVTWDAQVRPDASLHAGIVARVFLQSARSIVLDTSRDLRAAASLRL